MSYPEVSALTQILQPGSLLIRKSMPVCLLVLPVTYLSNCGIPRILPRIQILQQGSLLIQIRNRLIFAYPAKGQDGELRHAN
jgi:hypothetical protein